MNKIFVRLISILATMETPQHIMMAGSNSTESEYVPHPVETFVNRMNPAA